MSSEVLLIIYGDTEDFITSEADDASLQIAQIFSMQGIKVVFKIVAEKLRGLELRNRRDVIEAISLHDIGYHSNTHSIHPTISEYIGNLGWDKGSLEFENREKQGYREVKKKFGQISCYGHPGMCWVPQAYPVLKKWDVPVYLDDTNTITPPLKERPYWYCNILNLMGLGSNSLPLDASGGTANVPNDWLIILRDEFQKIYKKLKAEKDVGLISLYVHSTTYVTEQLWDKINFSGGKNPADDIYKKPRLKSSEQTRKDFDNLNKFITLIKTLPRIHFITAKDALSIYRDKADEREFSRAEMMSLCERSIERIYCEKIEDGVWVSAAEIFSMVLNCLRILFETGTLPKTTKCLHPFGPKENYATETINNGIDFNKLLKACSTEHEKILRTGYLPSSIEIDGNSLSPIDLFATCCDTYLSLSKGKRQNQIQIRKGNFEIGNMATEKGARLDWGETYTNPQDFEALKQVEIAKLQTWTLKPAIPDLSQLKHLS